MNQKEENKKNESILPTSKKPALAVNPKMLVLYGAPKVGKTQFLSELDNCLILDIDTGGTGTDYVEALKIKANSLQELAEICKAIKTEKHDYKFLAIDVFDQLENWCEISATQKYKNSTMGKNFEGSSVLLLPNGAGYKWLREEIELWLQAFRSLNLNLILISHLKVSAINKGGADVQAKDLDLTGKIKNIVCGMADAIGYIYRGDEKELRISFSTNDDVNCGSRCEHLRGADFEADWKKIYLD
jgi:hypothetical protein